MELTSLARLRRYCGKLSDSPDVNAELSVFLLSVSANIEEYLCREIEIKERIEYFASNEGQWVYFPKAYPIISVDSIYTSVTGKFEGEEVEETDYHFGPGATSIVFRRDMGRRHRSVKITYTGGLAIDPVLSTYTLTGVGTADFELDQFVKGSKSRAVGKVVSNSPDTTLILEGIYGKFRLTDVLSAYQLENLSGNVISNTEGTISAIVAQSLAEAHPAIPMATEFEVNYLFRNSRNSSLWIQNTNKEGSQKRPSDYEYNLQPETRMMLRGYERVLA